MPTFRIYVEYDDAVTGKRVKDVHITQMETAEHGNRVAISKYKSFARGGTVFVNKIKLVRV